MCSRNGLRACDALHRADALDRLAGEQIGIVRVDGEGRVARFDVLDERLRQPTRELLERTRGRVREAQQRQRLVAPHRFDVRRAGAIRGLGDLAHERRRFRRHAAVRERADDDEALAGAQIQRDADDQVRVAAQRAVEVHWHSRLLCAIIRGLA
jgi:hypothetical protein